ncbi:hypothetical protein E3U43_014669, partial [Larimichthys crocea]
MTWMTSLNIWMQPHLPCNILTVWAFEVQIHHMELSSRLPGLQELHVMRSSSPSTTNLSSTYSPRSPICPMQSLQWPVPVPMPVSYNPYYGYPRS